MSTQGALSRARLLPTFLGVLLLGLGIIMVIGGFRLSGLGGSFYYMLCGFGFSAIGILLVIGLRFAVWLFTLMLLLSTVWALWEVGLDRQRLMPRLFVWLLVGLVLYCRLHVRRSNLPGSACQSAASSSLWSWRASRSTPSVSSSTSLTIRRKSWPRWFRAWSCRGCHLPRHKPGSGSRKASRRRSIAGSAKLHPVVSVIELIAA